MSKGTKQAIALGIAAVALLAAPEILETLVAVLGVVA